MTRTASTASTVSTVASPSTTPTSPGAPPVAPALTANDRTLLRAAQWLSDASRVPATAHLTEWADAVKRAAIGARLANALSECDGNRAHAGRLLGVSDVRVVQLLAGYPELVKRFPAKPGNPDNRARGVAKAERAAKESQPRRS